MRKNIVAGNWKMNHDLAQTEMFLVDLKKQVFPENVEVIIAPAFTNLHHAFQSVREHPVTVAAQNMHESENGAFTGEVSAAMLASIGVSTVILGHSERRAYFSETDTLLSGKVKTALANNMRVIFCVGEKLDDRKANKHDDVVKTQLENALFQVSEGDWQQLIIAYEPVWAIGTGETATPAQAQEMHKLIRQSIAEAYSQDLADSVSILYGGSVKPDNAAEIFGQPDVDGGLIGGASLQVASFMEIANSFSDK